MCIRDRFKAYFWRILKNHKAMIKICVIFIKKKQWIWYVVLKRLNGGASHKDNDSLIVLIKGISSNCLTLSIIARWAVLLNLLIEADAINTKTRQYKFSFFSTFTKDILSFTAIIRRSKNVYSAFLTNDVDLFIGLIKDI